MLPIQTILAFYNLHEYIDSVASLKVFETFLETLSPVCQQKILFLQGNVQKYFSTYLVK